MPCGTPRGAQAVAPSRLRRFDSGLWCVVPRRSRTASKTRNTFDYAETPIHPDRNCLDVCPNTHANYCERRRRSSSRLSRARKKSHTASRGSTPRSKTSCCFWITQRSVRRIFTMSRNSLAAQCQCLWHGESEFFASHSSRAII